MKRRKLRRSTPEEEAEFAAAFSAEKPTVKDKLAMLFSAFLVIFLPCVLILFALAALILLLFGGF